MFEATELLRSYAQGIRSLSGAGSVALFVPAPLSGQAEPLLIHDGDSAPVPELAGVEAALGFVSNFDDSALRQESSDSGTLHVVPSSTDGCCLIALPSVDAIGSPSYLSELLQIGEESSGRRKTDDPGEEPILPAAWLGLRFAAGRGGSAVEMLADDSLRNKLSKDDPGRWWEWLFAMGGALASHTTQITAILRDPITGLPDRAGFQAVLTEEIEKSLRKERPLSLLLINPDDFAQINERFGREAGDATVKEISQRLRISLRATDPVARYGGVIFAAVLIGTPQDEARVVSDKILQRLTEGAFLDGAVRLGFSIGIAVLDPAEIESRQALHLIRRADQALNAAKRLGGGCIVDWDERSSIEETGAFDRMSGIFTGNMSKDYRNMVLLSDAIDIVAVHKESETLAGETVEMLYGALKPDRVGLFTRDDDGDLRLVRGLTREREQAVRQKRMETLELVAEEIELMRLAIAAGEPRWSALEAVPGKTIRIAVPLITSHESVDAIFLEGAADSMALETSDLIFLKTLASQLAVALDRARLSELESRRQESERRKLRAELNDLRQAIQQSRMVYRSAEIDALIATCRQVAPTDATVLITGESGTGKELLARTVHELSARRDQPLVVVDCGSIATTLIESELFGHEKGAYTGAQGRRVGRLAEANGGTVLLDEIGELPLEVQSKLLRFVQEKQFTTVGGSRPRRVDVRILAATNRDLGSEVAAGLFREDLYYRLNVVRLEMPPLRERPDDILHLARHFVETFSVQYQKSIRRLTPDAEDALVRYPWPGNVRELQNRLMQAVILCDGEELSARELKLPQPTGVPAPALDAGGHAAATDAPFATAPSGDQLWAQLRVVLAKQIDSVLGSSVPALPLGKWLNDDLILAADGASAGIARRAAARVGIPETTFRRRLTKASQMAEAGLSPRAGGWDDVRSVLADLVRGEIDDGDLLERAERILLEEILVRVPNDTRTGSGLLGVTAPTYRVRVSQLAESA